MHGELLETADNKAYSHLEKKFQGIIIVFIPMYVAKGEGNPFIFVRNHHLNAGIHSRSDL